MWIYWGIVGGIDWLSRFFYEVYLECHYAFYIPEDVAYIFFKIHDMFAQLEWYFYDWGVWLESQLALIAETLSWETIKSYIRQWMPFIDDILYWYFYFYDEFLMFTHDPISWLKYRFYYIILPWGIDNIPFFSTLNYWYTTLKSNIELIMSDPIGWLTTQFRDVVLPWAIDNIPFFSTLYDFTNKLIGEFLAFLNDPLLWLKTKFKDEVLPWAIDNIPFFSTLYCWIFNYESNIDWVMPDPVRWLIDRIKEQGWYDFLTDPLSWLETEFTDWFLGGE